MKKLFILMFLVILLAGVVSSFEFDNVKEYDEETKTITVKNAFGLGADIATIRLNTPLENKVEPKYTKVAEFYLESYDDYNNPFKELELFDKKRGNNKFNRDFDWKVLTYEMDTVNDFGDACSGTFANGTANGCEYGIIGSHQELLPKWTKITPASFKKNENLTIGLFTKVEFQDHVEWIPNFFGVRITEWAIWTTDLDVGLFQYWSFDQSTTTTVNNNVTGGTAGTMAGIGAGDWTTGILGNALSFDAGTGEGVATTGMVSTEKCFTFNYWVKNRGSADSSFVMDIETGRLGMNFASGNLAIVGAGSLTSSAIVDAFQMVTFSWDCLAGETRVYINGTLDGTGTIVNRSIDDTIAMGVRFNIGGEPTADMILDEFGIWNRTLTQAEITFLYNNGDACAFGDATCGDQPPTVNLDSPANTTNFTLTNDISFNATLFDDTNISNASLYLDDLVNATNLTAGVNNSLYNFDVINLAEGNHTWTMEACNFGNLCANATQRTFSINTTPNIQYGAGVPPNFFNATDNFFDVNVTLTEALFLNVTFDLYNTNAGLNQTVTFTNSTRNQNWSNLPDGNYSYNVTVATSTNQFNNTETRNISIDINFPLITVTSPTGDQGTFSSGTNLTLAWTASDVNLDVCQYDYQGFNTTVACGSSPINLTVNDSTQTSLTFYVNDTFGQTSFNSTNWSYSFIENNITFTPNVFETSSQFFQINLSTSLNVSAISAELNYNGTTFISSAACDDFCLVNNTIDIPLVTSLLEFENKSFFWEISIFNGTDSINVNTSSTQQNVTRIHLEECDATFTTEALNFTVYDEQNLSRIDPFLFDGDFEQWLGTGTVKRQSNFTNSSISEKDLCISPVDETFFIDATIEYDEAGNASEYTLRNYYFQNDTISNVSQKIFMYLLQSSFSTSFILKVQDDALLPVPNVLIETNRFYPGLNEFRIVQIAKTDDLGKSVGFFETEIVDYKFIITFNNVSLLETGIQKVIPESSPFTLTFNLGENLGEPWATQEPLDNLISTLIWNNNTGIITYTYADNSTNLTLARLFVIQQSLINTSADSTICNVNSSLDAAILTCDVGNDSGFYTASSFITRDSTEVLDLQIGFQIETLSSVVGLLGLFYGWFLILIASFMFKFNEIAGIWAITIVVVLVNIMGLINFGGVFVTAIMGVAIFLTWLMSN